MAGTYPDVPGTRFDLARDGTLCFSRYDNGPAPIYYTPTQVAGVMDLDPAVAITYTRPNYTGTYLTFLFPEPRLITGLNWMLDRDGAVGQLAWSASYSLDTTDGINGTWTAFPGQGGGRNVTPAMANVVPAYRSAIQAVNVANVRAVRLNANDTQGYGGNMCLRCIHIYGTRQTSGVDRLAFWHPTLDQELTGAYFDFGDVARGQVTGPKTFRIKNLSTTKAATALQVQASGLAGSPLPTPGALLSVDGGAVWQATTPAVNLAAGAVTPVYSCQLNLSDVLVTPQARSARLSTIVGSYA